MEAIVGGGALRGTSLSVTGSGSLSGRLDVGGPVRTGSHFRLANDAPLVGETAQGGSLGIARVDSGNRVRLGDAGEVAIVNGKVGIGTTSPLAALDVRGNVRADNILSAEAFTGGLTNSGDFVFSDAGGHHNLKYTNVLQNSAPDVFEMRSDGGLRILKAGVVSMTANFDSIACSGCNYAEMRVLVNGQVVSMTLGHSSGTSYWTQVSATLHWKANAGDVFQFQSRPDTLRSVDNSPWSTLTAMWIGAK